MEFFGTTLHGPQNSFKDVLKRNYKEPMSKEDVQLLMSEDFDIIRVIDCYLGRVNGFAYGSTERFNKMKRKGVIKPVGPSEMYRLPPTTSIEYGWWHHDPVIINTTWHGTHPRRPQPTSPNTLILDIVRKNNKYASLF